MRSKCCDWQQTDGEITTHRGRNHHHLLHPPRHRQQPHHPLRQSQWTWLGLKQRKIIWKEWCASSLTIKSPLAVIIDDRVVALLEQFDCWESLDLNILQLIGCGVHLGNHNTITESVEWSGRMFADNSPVWVLILLSQFVPGGLQLFAVSAPGQFSSIISNTLTTA